MAKEEEEGDGGEAGDGGGGSLLSRVCWSRCFECRPACPRGSHGALRRRRIRACHPNKHSTRLPLLVVHSPRMLVHPRPVSILRGRRRPSRASMPKQLGARRIGSAAASLERRGGQQDPTRHSHHTTIRGFHYTAAKQDRTGQCGLPDK